jgi:hypothetical protein
MHSHSRTQAITGAPPGIRLCLLPMRNTKKYNRRWIESQGRNTTPQAAEHRENPSKTYWF